MLCKTALELYYFRSNARKPLCLAKGTTKMGRMEIKSDKLHGISSHFNSAFSFKIGENGFRVPVFAHLTRILKGKNVKYIYTQ